MTSNGIDVADEAVLALDYDHIWGYGIMLREIRSFRYLKFNVRDDEIKMCLFEAKVSAAPFHL